MRKFKFNLESLLVVRDWEEQKSRQRLSEANARVRVLMGDLDRIWELKESAVESWRQQGAERFSPRDRINMSSQLAALDARRDDLKQQIECAKAERAAAMATLKQATRNKRVVENIRERRFAEHSAEVDHMETIELEDIFNARNKAR